LPAIPEISPTKTRTPVQSWIAAAGRVLNSSRTEEGNSPDRTAAGKFLRRLYRRSGGFELQPPDLLIF